MGNGPGAIAEYDALTERYPLHGICSIPRPQQEPRQRAEAVQSRCCTSVRRRSLRMFPRRLPCEDDRLRHGALFKVSPAHHQEIGPATAPLLIQGENIISAYKAMRDSWFSPTSG